MTDSPEMNPLSDRFLKEVASGLDHFRHLQGTAAAQELLHLRSVVAGFSKEPDVQPAKCLINMRAPRSLVAMIDKAAGLRGQTRTAFMLDAARQEAWRIIRERGPQEVPRPPTPRENA